MYLLLTLLLTLIINSANSQKYVPMPIPLEPLPVTIRIQSDGNNGIVNRLGRRQPKYWNRMSRNKIKMSSIVSYTVSLPRPPINEKNKLLIYVPGRHNAFPYIGQPISANHEVGHEFRLDHSDTRIFEDQNKISFYKKNNDPWSPMTSTGPGALTLNPPHLHRLGWFNPREIAFLEERPYMLVNYFNPNKIDLFSLKVLYYVVRDRRYWFIYNDNFKNMAIFSAENGKGDRGLTYYEGGLGFGKVHIRTGVMFRLHDNTGNFFNITASIDKNWTFENSTLEK